MDKTEIIEFIRGKVASAESSLRSREEMERVWSSGDDDSWRTIAMMHSSTIGKHFNKEDRAREAARHRRIALRCRHELAMFRSALLLLEGEPSEKPLAKSPAVPIVGPRNEMK